MAPFQANILSWKIIMDALEKVRIVLFIINIKQVLVQWISGNSLMKKYYKNNFEFHKIIKK